MKFETPIAPQDLEIIPGMTDHTQSDHAVTDASEFPAIQLDDADQVSQDALPYPEAGDDNRSVTERIKDGYYRAGSMITMATTTGEMSNSPVWTNTYAKRRRRMVERGIGMLALAKLGFDFYKASKGLHASFQGSDLLNNVMPGDLAVETIDVPEKQQKPQHGIDYGAMAEGTLDTMLEGAEGVTNALLNTPSNSRKVAKAKGKKTPKK